jgi:hypothetical protein
MMIHSFLFGLVLNVQAQKIAMADIEALTLKKGHYTSSRRTGPIPQLKCIYGDACDSGLTPQVVHCQNVSKGSNNPRWKCNADLDSSVRLGKVTVICEGYTRPNDPEVLLNSCGLEYRLHRTKNNDNSDVKSERKINREVRRQNRKDNIRILFEAGDSTTLSDIILMFPLRTILSLVFGFIQFLIDLFYALIDFLISTVLTMLSFGVMYVLIWFWREYSESEMAKYFPDAWFPEQNFYWIVKLRDMFKKEPVVATPIAETSSISSSDDGFVKVSSQNPKED